jgi:hypothetical protein
MIVEPAEVALAAIIFGTTSVTILSLARMRMRVNERRGGQLTDPGVDDRLYRIEQAVDAIALEVERMAESQRFTARLLAERLPTPEALPGAERGRT